MCWNEFMHRFSENQLFFSVVQIRIDRHRSFTTTISNLHDTEFSSNTHDFTNIISKSRRECAHSIGEDITIPFDVINDFGFFLGNLFEYSIDRWESKFEWIHWLLTRMVASELVKHWAIRAECLATTRSPRKSPIQWYASSKERLVRSFASCQ